MVDDRRLIHRGIDDGELAQPYHDCLDDERKEGQLGTALGVGVFVLAAKLVDVGEIDLEDRRHVRRDLLGKDHVLGDLLAHHRERLDAVVLAGGEGHGGRTRSCFLSCRGLLLGCRR